MGKSAKYTKKLGLTFPNPRPTLPAWMTTTKPLNSPMRCTWPVK